jgi:cytochrome c-type biogenesis protein CcmF
VRETYAIIGFLLCLFVLGTILQEFVRGVVARRHATGEGVLTAFGTLIRRNNRRYGGYIVHLGILLIGAGVVGSHVYQQETQGTLGPGQSLTLGGYTVTSRGIQTYPVPGARVVEAVLDVNGNDLRPQKVFFQNFEKQPSTKVGLRSTPLEDLYVVLSGWDGDGPTAQVSLSVFVNPLVSWIWLGGLVLLFGTLVALWPAPEPVARRSEARVPKGAVGVAG